jgi:hypothetical protein
VPGGDDGVSYVRSVLPGSLTPMARLHQP